MSLETSASLKELGAALAKFQSQVPNVKKDGTNPFFKSKYATLENVIDTVRKPLAANGLSFSQFPSGENELSTILIHSSGEFISATAKMTPKDNTPQGQGSAITYLRRYSLSAILGIATEDDDDGNAASTARREPMKPYSVPRSQPKEDEDESGAAIMNPDEIVEVKKDKIKKLMKALGKVPTPKAVRDLTGIALQESAYDEIITRLKDLIDAAELVGEFDRTIN